VTTPLPRRDEAPAWDRSDVAALAGLLLVLVVFAARSWLAWGHPEDDYGREMWTPLRVLEGEVMYRDFRYRYGPFSPYLHALLYGAWKPHLNVLYASGLLSTALVVVTLYAAGRQIASRAVAAGACLLAMVDLMFFPGGVGTFSYVFPYAYPALHGLLWLLLALAASLHAIRTPSRAAFAISGVGIGLALLTKHEAAGIAVGLGGLTVLATLLRDRRAALLAAAAIAVPALGIPALAYGALSLAMPTPRIILDTLFEPGYFNRTFFWHTAGFSTDAPTSEIVATLAAQHASAAALYGPGLLLVAAMGWARSSRVKQTARWVALALACAGFAWILWRVGAAVTTGPGAARALVLALKPRYGGLPIVLGGWLVVETAIAARSAWKREAPAVANLQRLVAVAVGLAMLHRVPASLVPLNYANFALPVALLLLCVLLFEIAPASLGALGANAGASRAAGLALVGLLAVAIGTERWHRWNERRTPFVTPVGTMLLARGDPYLPMYREALELIEKETAPDTRIAAIPGENSLYFLSGRKNGLYEINLIGLLNSPEEERAYVADLERENPSLILISSRPQFEYGRLAFGVDHGHIVQRWIEENYERLDRTLGKKMVRAQVWRRRDSADKG